MEDISILSIILKKDLPSLGFSPLPLFPVWWPQDREGMFHHCLDRIPRVCFQPILRLPFQALADCHNRCESGQDRFWFCLCLSPFIQKTVKKLSKTSSFSSCYVLLGSLRLRWKFCESVICECSVNKASHLITPGRGPDEGGDMVETNNKSILRLLLVSLGMGVFLASSCSHFQGRIPGSESQVQTIKSITPKEAYTLILKNKGNQSFEVLDVRTPAEFADGHIENAVNLDYYSETFKKALNNLDHNKTYLIYCGVGSRAGRASDLMKELGFREVYNIAGGFTDWKKAGLPTTNKLGFHGLGVQLANRFRIFWIECVRSGISAFELQDCRA